jgi:hypothetical protein
VISPRAAGVLAAVVLAVSALVSARAHARTRVTGEPESIDDPKLSRRLGTRIVLPGGSPDGASAASDPPPTPAAAPGAASSSPAWSSESTGGEPTVLARRAAPPAEKKYVPHFKLGFRRFDFVQVGAADTGSTSGTAASEPFDCLSFDVYPVSSFVRFGLSTMYGWQAGAFATKGDYILAQSFSLGAQLPGALFTPFVETFGGFGYMRRLQFQRTVPTAYWQLGVDVGTEVAIGHGFLVSAAVGYIHPVNGLAQAVNGSSTSVALGSVYVDTWSFKFAFGI